MDTKAQALLELGRALVRERYEFVTTTPTTHQRVIARREQARDLRDVFGYSLPFARELLAPGLVNLLEAATALRVRSDGLCVSQVRFSTLDGSLYVHSAFPTVESDAVFFGPDTYRFCAFLKRAVPRARSVVDIGCGSGAGGLVAARAAEAERVVLADINPRALAYAEVNAALQARSVECANSDVLSQVSGSFDVIVANPPYMLDGVGRAYRDGGGAFGEALSVRIAREALARLAPGGTLLLYTGAPVVGGSDRFFSALDLAGSAWRYEELDPDVFGEELEQPGYEQVERIAAVALTVRAPGGEPLATREPR